MLFFPLLFSCGQEEQGPSTEPVELKFNVDTTLLAPISLVRNKILFNPPLYWNEVSDKVFDELNSKIKEILAEENEISFQPLKVFVSDSTGGILNIGAVNILNATGRDSQLKRYEELLRKKHSPDKVKSANFLKDGIYISQFLIEEKQFITFKLLLNYENNLFIEFDYIIPSNFYINEIKAVESSIGSIKNINKNGGER